MDEKKMALSLLNEQASPEFMDLVKKRYAEEFADEALKLIKEFKKLEKAYTVYKGWVDKLEAGDLTVLEEYKKKRHRLEMEEDYVF